MSKKFFKNLFQLTAYSIVGSNVQKLRFLGDLYFEVCTIYIIWIRKSRRLEEELSDQLENHINQFIVGFIILAFIS